MAGGRGGRPCPPCLGLTPPGRSRSGSSPGLLWEEGVGQEQEEGQEWQDQRYLEQKEEQEQEYLEQEEGGHIRGAYLVTQLDGNISLCGSSSSLDNEDSSPIPVWTGHRPARKMPTVRTSVRRTIRRSNKLVDALSAPRITLYNARSAWSKLTSLAEDMEMRSTDICFLTEVWQQSENRKHKEAIEELLELRGVKYVSTPRPGARRGGGTALACSEEYFHLTKLNVAIPKPLEACFALVKPKNPTGKVSSFICCSFYSPPRST